VDSSVGTDAQMWSLIVAFFMPPVLAIIQQPTWSNPLRAVITFLASAVAAAGTAYFAASLDFSNWVHSGLIILVGTIAMYHGSWKPVGIAPAIELGTSGGKARRVDDHRRR
jgi:hypothetical protein